MNPLRQGTTKKWFEELVFEEKTFHIRFLKTWHIGVAIWSYLDTCFAAMFPNYNDASISPFFDIHTAQSWGVLDFY